MPHACASQHHWAICTRITDTNRHIRTYCVTHCLWPALSSTSYQNKILPVAARSSQFFIPLQMTHMYRVNITTETLNLTHTHTYSRVRSRHHAVSFSLFTIAFIGSICIRLLRSHSLRTIFNDYLNLMLRRYIIRSMDAKIIPELCV